jgi:hypothetical protein
MKFTLYIKAIPIICICLFVHVELKSQSLLRAIPRDNAFIRAALCSTGGYNDWRVRSIKELYSLINFNGKSAPVASDCLAYLDTNYFGMAFGDTETLHLNEVLHNSDLYV